MAVGGAEVRIFSLLGLTVPFIYNAKQTRILHSIRQTTSQRGGCERGHIGEEQCNQRSGTSFTHRHNRKNYICPVQNFNIKCFSHLILTYSKDRKYSEYLCTYKVQLYLLQATCNSASLKERIKVQQPVGLSQSKQTMSKQTKIDKTIYTVR